MMKKRLFLFLAAAIIVSAGVSVLSAQDSIRISQIDSRTLLINQQVKAYISVTDSTGKPVAGLSRNAFSVSELSDSGMVERQILSFQEGVNINGGINILFVMDNSGSMYWDSSGKIKNSADEGIWRITFAKNAVLSLLKDMKNPNDRAGLLSFNVKIQAQVRPTKNRVEVERSLAEIEKPSEEEAYTELYEALYASVDLLKTLHGRKVIILLSDGQNFPLENNPFFPERHGMDQAVDFALHEGISVYTIGLTDRADRKNLAAIARETGGAYFTVHNPKRLASLYFLIREQIMGEYLLTYRAAMGTAEKRLVHLEHESSGGVLSAERYYYAGTLLGRPQERFDLMILLAIPLAATVMVILGTVKFEKKESGPNLTVYRGTGKRRRLQTLPLDGRTSVTIAANRDADLTITGDSGIGNLEVKIEKKDDKYRVSGSSITVNNRPVHSRVLKSGDCITLGGTNIVFDEGTRKSKGKRTGRT